LASDREPWSPRREEAYIGVLVDDLITLGTKEPYRMFTSRAEYRLLLREDNADLRLTEKGRELGLVGDQRWAVFCAKREGMEREQTRLKTSWIQPGTDKAKKVNALLDKPISHEYSLLDLLRRPEVDYLPLMQAAGFEPEAPAVAEQVEILAKYAGYIDRQADEVEKLRASENTPLPAAFDYAGVSGLSNELRQKLEQIRPATLGQASRIQGMTPAAISLLRIYLKKHSAGRQVQV
jgi:tRNA uridine 5-carboxymethylaminomethyl modification enzyme